MTTNSAASETPTPSAGSSELSQLFQRLRAPFSSSQISWRVGSRNREKTRGQALPYIDARVVHNRLDEVVGPQNWKNELVAAPNGGGVMTILYIRVNGEWIGKSDVAQQDEVRDPQASGAGGAPAQGQDPNQKREIAIKGAVSDSMKRAAVLWGIGRYLYDYEAAWVALKNEGRDFAEPPQLPDYMLPENERRGGRGQGQRPAGNAGAAREPSRGSAPQGSAPSSNAPAQSGAASAGQPPATSTPAPASVPAQGQAGAAPSTGAASGAPTGNTKITTEQWNSLDESVRKHVRMLSQRIERRVDLPSVELFIKSGKGQDYPQWLKEALLARIKEARDSGPNSSEQSSAAA